MRASEIEARKRKIVISLCSFFFSSHIVDFKKIECGPREKANAKEWRAHYEKEVWGPGRPALPK